MSDVLLGMLSAMATIESTAEIVCGRYTDYVGRNERAVTRELYQTVWCWSDGMVTTKPVRPQRAAWEKRKPIEWEKVSDVRIRDLDGWRDGTPIDMPLTWDEYEKRQNRCTVAPKKSLDEEYRSVFARRDDDE